MYPKAQYETNINYQGPPWRNFFPHCTFRPCVAGDAGKLLVTGTGWAGDFYFFHFSCSSQELRQGQGRNKSCRALNNWLVVLTRKTELLGLRWMELKGQKEVVRELKRAARWEAALPSIEGKGFPVSWVVSRHCPTVPLWTAETNTGLRADFSLWGNVKEH